jgi:hypothetical protein
MRCSVMALKAIRAGEAEARPRCRARSRQAGLVAAHRPLRLSAVHSATEQAHDQACERNRKDTSQYDRNATLAEKQIFRKSDEYD